jgi:cytochrome P450
MAGMSDTISVAPSVDLDLGDETLTGLHERFHEMRAESPAWMAEIFGTPTLLLLSYEHVAAGFKDEAVLPAARLSLATVAHSLGRFITTFEGEEHRLRRAIISPPFRARIVPAYLEMIKQTAVELVDEVAPLGETDLVRTFTKRFPLRVISNMLGIPVGNDDLMAKWALDLIRWNFDPEAAMAARAAFIEFATPIIEDRRINPRDDLISHVIHTEVDGQRLDDECVHSFVRHLFPAGADTTYLGTGNTLMTLLANPDLLALARDEPERRRAIVEEVLRYEAPIGMQPRMSPFDRTIEWNGYELPPGTIVMLTIMAANRDPAAFPDPDRIDIDRKSDNPPLTFGFGAHFCIGNHLALAEMTVALEAILDGLPGLELQPGSDAAVGGTILRGPASLPVRYEARARP